MLTKVELILVHACKDCGSANRDYSSITPVKYIEKNLCNISIIKGTNMEYVVGIIIIIVLFKLFSGNGGSYKNFSCDSCGKKALDHIETYQSGKEVLKCRKCGNRQTNEPPEYWDK